MSAPAGPPEARIAYFAAKREEHRGLRVLEGERLLAAEGITAEQYWERVLAAGGHAWPPAGALLNEGIADWPVEDRKVLPFRAPQNSEKTSPPPTPTPPKGKYPTRTFGRSFGGR